MCWLCYSHSSSCCLQGAATKNPKRVKSQSTLWRLGQQIQTHQLCDADVLGTLQVLMDFFRRAWHHVFRSSAAHIMPQESRIVLSFLSPSSSHESCSNVMLSVGRQTPSLTSSSWAPGHQGAADRNVCGSTHTQSHVCLCLQYMEVYLRISMCLCVCMLLYVFVYVCIYTYVSVQGLRC